MSQGFEGLVSRMSTPAVFRRMMRHLVVIALLVVMLYPLLWMLSASFKPNSEVFANTGLIPRNFTLSNYIDGWTALNYGFERFFFNSAVVAVLSVLGNLMACSITAYVIARMRFAGRNIVLGLVLLTIMLPHHVLLIPQYIMFSWFGWVNTFWPLILPKFLATDSFFIFLMVQFIRSLPIELDEAARIDGCGPIRLFFYVILPLISPALITTAIFTFIWTWNDFFTPLIYLGDPSMFTLPLALRAFLDSTGTSSYGSLFAMSLLALGPILGFFFVAQKYLVDGISTTGLK